MQTWLITGCSTGFGRELALAVLARGWQAAVTARNPADIADIAAAHPERCLALQLDVRERGQIAEAAQQRRASELGPRYSANGAIRPRSAPLVRCSAPETGTRHRPPDWLPISTDA
jgi:NAD(P)-dependent dehydrogenase (short-subunit alcohol dehydrogenase family)